jgi:hypothetical protein
MSTELREAHKKSHDTEGGVPCGRAQRGDWGAVALFEGCASNPAAASPSPPIDVPEIKPKNVVK